MRRKWLVQIGALFLMVLLAVGCTDDEKEQATAQAVAEEILSTNTPTSTPTNTPLPPTDTPTPVPPTNTPTPIPPTNTPTPVPPTNTPTPVPAPAFMVEDEVEDAIVCDSQATAVDPEVDIISVRGARQEDDVMIGVQLGSPLENDYSFAVLMALFSSSQQTDVSGYIWELHDGAFRIGEMDYQTGALIAETGEDLAIDHDRNAGVVTYTLALSDTVGLDQVYISSFHTPQNGEAKNCDNAGPYALEAFTNN